MGSNASEYLKPFEFLIEKFGYTLKQSSYDAATFGNFFADYVSSQLLIRVIRERGLYFMEFASPNEETKRFNLGDVLSLLDAGPLASQTLEVVTISFQDHYDRIVRLFADEEYPRTREALVAMGKERVKQLLKKYEKSDTP